MTSSIPNSNTPLFRNRAYLSVFSIGFLQSVARWLELLALSVYVFDVTNSPFLVALVTLLRVAPLALFGTLFGPLCDRYARRSVFIWGLVAMIVLTSAVAWLAVTGQLQLWQIFVASFLGGIFWILDFTIRRALVGEAVSASELGRAMGFDTVANNGTRMIGPLLGGTFLQVMGLHGAMLIAVAFYLACLLVTVCMSIGRVPTVRDDEKEGIIAGMSKGLKTVFSSPVLAPVMLVTVVYNLFGFPTLSMVPVIGRDDLELSASIVGLLASMEGAGAMVGGLLIATMGQMSQFRRIYVFGLTLSLLAGSIWASAGHVHATGLALLAVGVGASGFAAMQTTLLILNTNEKERGAVLGVLSVGVGTALVGFTQVGLVANHWSPQTAVVVSTVLGVFSLLLIYFKWPGIIGRQQHPGQTPR